MSTSSVSARQFATINQFAAPPVNHLNNRTSNNAVRAGRPTPPQGRTAPGAPPAAQATPVNPLKFTTTAGSGAVIDAAADAGGIFKVASLL